MRKDLIIGIQARSASEWVNAAAKDSLAGAPCSYSMSPPKDVRAFAFEFAESGVLATFR